MRLCDKNQISEDVFDFMITYPFPRSPSVLNLLNFFPSVYLYTSKTNVLGGILESAYLSVHVSLCVSVCLQNAGSGIKSHLVTALVVIANIILQ